MTPLFKKLNFKDHTVIYIIGAPNTFSVEISDIQPFTKVIEMLDENTKASFVLAFASAQSEVDALAHLFSNQTAPDAVLWIAYPKMSSKRYQCTFNRDTGWALLGEMGFEPVRQVAIDEDWSALRFRRPEHIKSMTRSFSISAGGKAKAAPVSLEMPGDLQSALHAVPDAQAAFERLAPSHRKEYMRWILEAKRPETRQQRVQKTIEKLLQSPTFYKP